MWASTWSTINSHQALVALSRPPEALPTVEHSLCGEASCPFLSLAPNRRRLCTAHAMGLSRRAPRPGPSGHQEDLSLPLSSPRYLDF